MTIDGENFGSTRGTSYVEVGGSRITASYYLAWSDKQIKIILPSNVQDGLVYVGTTAGNSSSEFFANAAGIPVVIQKPARSIVPEIEKIEPEKASVGQIVTITGTNFGETQENSVVYFTANLDTQGAAGNSSYQLAQDTSINKDEFISVDESQLDYVSWSDTEIQVRVPDGAASGQMYIETETGKSSAKKFTLNTEAGRKSYTGKRTYIIQLSADIANSIASSDTLISLYVPRPCVSSIQPVADLTECYPEPLSKDDKVIIHQKQLSQISNRKQRFTQNFVISNYALTSTVRSQFIIPFNQEAHPELVQYTKADSLVPSNTMDVINLVDDIIGASTNPYNQAKLIYNYFIKNYKILSEVRTGNSSVLDLAKNKTGDAYDFAILYAAICRSAGIPAIPVSGILIEDKSTSRNHWWVELYFENFGWFPVDVALGAGLDYKPYVTIRDPYSYYFGNLDSQHIAFSRGWNEITPMFVDSKTVYRPRTYALQSIWEESTSGINSYSSLWNDPIVLGIY